MNAIQHFGVAHNVFMFNDLINTTIIIELFNYF